MINVSAHPTTIFSKSAPVVDCRHFDVHLQRIQSGSGPNLFTNLPAERRAVKAAERMQSQPPCPGVHAQCSRLPLEISDDDGLVPAVSHNLLFHAYDTEGPAIAGPSSSKIPVDSHSSSHFHSPSIVDSTTTLSRPSSQWSSPWPFGHSDPS
jgi:hypothetical protein